MWENKEDVKRIDFVNDIETWKYSGEKEKVKFNDSSTMRTSEGKKDSQGMENKMVAEGVFYLHRKSLPYEKFAAVVPKEQYNDPGVIEAINEELNKWVSFEAG